MAVSNYHCTRNVEHLKITRLSIQQVTHNLAVFFSSTIDVTAFQPFSASSMVGSFK
jgi:hypothetical protein